MFSHINCNIFPLLVIFSLLRISEELNFYCMMTYFRTSILQAETQKHGIEELKSIKQIRVRVPCPLINYGFCLLNSYSCWSNAYPCLSYLTSALFSLLLTILTIFNFLLISNYYTELFLPNGGPILVEAIHRLLDDNVEYVEFISC